MPVAPSMRMPVLHVATRWRRVGGLGSCGVLLALLAPPQLAAAPSPLYLRDHLTLSIAAPSATEPRDDVSASVGSGQRAVLAEFLSAPVDEEVRPATATVTLYLVTGRLGMEGCAVVTAEVVRRTPPAERTVVGTQSVQTSILPRRETIDPIEITMGLQDVLARPGERIGVTIAVENRCGELRIPKLLYDALGSASAVAFSGELPPATTTTTTTMLPAPPPTTTTLPWPAGCLFQPLSGYEAAFCRLDTLAQVLDEKGPGALGGPATYGRLRRRLKRAHDLVAVAQTGRRVRRRLRRALLQLGVFDRLVRRRGRRGVVDPDLGEEIGGLVRGAIGQIGLLRSPRGRLERDQPPPASP
jgi:hypothetical protein